ncbi:MAG: DUF4340 domain-containing protein [Leptospiraceae bacterium]|nr:DUF4340 domain-containing protein [Leptospiraceae bacterium]MCP5498856.1 DUF4340 domain-containing protein [Leptospiraceae bacterium]
MNIFKVLLIISSFLVFSIVFLFSGKKEEKEDEFVIWKHDFTALSYSYSGGGNACPGFLESSFTVKRLPHSLREQPVFSITDSQGFVYEAGYLTKNLLKELAVLRSDTSLADTEKNRLEFHIQDKCPIVKLHKTNKETVTIFLGRLSRDKSFRYILADKKITRLPAYTLDRFKRKLREFRNPSFISLKGYEFESLKYSENTKFLADFKYLANRKSKFWLNNKTDKPLSPPHSSKLSGFILSLSIDKYADEISIIHSLSSEQSRLEIQLTNGDFYSISIYKSILIDSVEYSPLQIKLEGKLQQSPAFIQKNRIEELRDLLQLIIKGK